MISKPEETPRLTFWHGIFAGIVGLGTMAIVFTLAPSNLGGPIGVCIGWAVFLGLWLHLTKVLRVAKPAIEFVVMAVLSVQLLAMGVLSPWFGWTTEMLSGWFGRFFVVIYVLGPMILIPSLSIWRRVWRKPIAQIESMPRNVSFIVLTLGNGSSKTVRFQAHGLELPASTLLELIQLKAHLSTEMSG